ncbi:MAG: DUF881 domain-containing protein [Actinomycetes bacterium]
MTEPDPPPDRQPDEQSVGPPERPPDPSPEHPSPERPESGPRRLLAAVRPRATRAQAVAAVLLALLGFGAAVQVRLIDSDDSLAGARQTDLIGILDNLSEREDRLRTEVNDLRTTRDQLAGGTDRRRIALEEAEKRLQSLGILAGTLPAEGPGITLTISDPDRSVEAAVLLDAVQELRDAGAEAIQIGTARVTARTYFVDRGNRIEVDGTVVDPPYRLVAVGDPRTMATALGIPGGVLESVQEQGATATVAQRDQVTVSALRPVATPEYARPAPGDQGGG